MQSTMRHMGAATLAAMAFALPSSAAAQPAGIDPQATKLVKASTDFLASQKRFSAETRSSLEVVLTSGQKIQFDHLARLSVQRPNKLRADRTGDLVEQSFYYDGKSLTLLNPGDKHFATVVAPGTLEEMLDMAQTKLDIVAPAGDLIRKNAYDILMTDVTQGFVVGKGVVEGVRSDALRPTADVSRAARRMLRDTGFELGVLYAGDRPPYAPRGPRATRPVTDLEARFAL